MGTQVTLDRYAGIRAEMEAGMLRDEVLARAGLSLDEWTAAQYAWLESMGAEIERDRFELTNRYARAFVERQRALATAATPPMAPIAAPATATAAPLPLPSYAAPPPPPAAPPAVVAPPGASLPAMHKHNPLLAGTMVGTLSPFAAAATPALPFAPTEASEVETLLPGPSPLAAALPFQKAPPGAAAPPPAAAAKPGLPPVKKANPALTGTMMGSLSSFAGPALPFAPTGAPASPPQPPPPLPEPPPPAHAAEAPVILGGLTLEQHASLCAEIGFDPAHTGEKLSRYRVTPEGKTELDRLWNERFAANPAEAARWRKAYQTYFVFLTAKRP